MTSVWPLLTDTYCILILSPQPRVHFPEPPEQNVPFRRDDRPKQAVCRLTRVRKPSGGGSTATARRREKGRTWSRKRKPDSPLSHHITASTLIILYNLIIKWQSPLHFPYSKWRTENIDRTRLLQRENLSVSFHAWEQTHSVLERSERWMSLGWALTDPHHSDHSIQQKRGKFSSHSGDKWKMWQKKKHRWGRVGSSEENAFNCFRIF